MDDQINERKSYPSDVTDDEWAFCAPYFTRMKEEAPQYEYPLREIFNALRYRIRAGCPWRMLLRLAQERNVVPSAVIIDGRTIQSTPESGSRAGYDGYKRKKGSKIHIAVDTLGHLLALKVTPANEQERDQVGEILDELQSSTGQCVRVMYADQGYTGEAAANAANQRGVELVVVKLPEAKRGFVLLPKRWVVERSFAWATRFRRLAKDYERLSSSVVGLHWLAFITLMLNSIFHKSA